MSEVFFSIIIPVYNVEKYLKECLDSVYSQEFTDFEIIAIDDGSTDSSRVILEEYKSKYGKMNILTQSNEGPSVARNNGLKAARGEWICFLDSDDIWLPSLLAAVHKYCDDSRELIAFDHIMVWDEINKSDFQMNSSEQKKIIEGSGQDVFVHRMDSHNYIAAVWGMCIKKEFIFRNNIFFVSGEYGADGPFTLKCNLMAKKAVYIYENLYVYRRREGSIVTSKNYTKKINDNISIIMQLINMIREIQMPIRVEEKALEDLKRVVRATDYYIELAGDYKMTYGAKSDEVYDFYKMLKIDDRKNYFQKDYYLQGLKKIIAESEGIIVYGAGGVGKTLGKYLRRNSLLDKVQTYCVTKIDGYGEVEGISVDSIDILSNYSRDRLIIIAAAATASEMEKVLLEMGFYNYIIIDNLLEQAMVKWLEEDTK